LEHEPHPRQAHHAGETRPLVVTPDGLPLPPARPHSDFRTGVASTRRKEFCPRNTQNTRKQERGQLCPRFIRQPTILDQRHTRFASPFPTSFCPDTKRRFSSTAFWHRHRGCRNCTTPMHRRAFWVNKLEGNAARDKVNQRALRELGWKTVIVWECDVDRPKSLDRLTRKLEKLLKQVHHDFRDL
jgi:hypothetical protein